MLPTGQDFDEENLSSELHYFALTMKNAELFEKIHATYELVRQNLNAQNIYIAERGISLTREELLALHTRSTDTLHILTLLAQQTLPYEGLADEHEWNVEDILTNARRHLGLDTDAA